MAISSELLKFFNSVKNTLENNKSLLNGPITDFDRKQILDGLGVAASNYRTKIYNDSFSGEKSTIEIKSISSFVNIALDFLEHSIDSNKREDNLYHAYNLMTVEEGNSIKISYLPEMLEGQVAVLSSGYLNTDSSLEVLDALKSSSLFRNDQYSYILYPNKNLPRFVDKNTLSENQIQSSELLKLLIKDGNKQVVTRDLRGDYHFNGNFNNVDFLKEALAKLPGSYKKLVEKESEKIYAIFEDIFNHKSFTGRSGTFFGYEGLGSIYWHMVSKLLLATLEVTKDAIGNNSDRSKIGRLFDHYYEINAGIGAHKSPELYGAFPTDPYSHTPGGKGAQQPGMTGQVKEDILSRFGELGFYVKNGCLGFSPDILNPSEFITKTQSFDYYDVKGQKQNIPISAGSLVFTICQVPIVYKSGAELGIIVEFNDGGTKNLKGKELDYETTQFIFKRLDKVKMIVVNVNK